MDPPQGKLKKDQSKDQLKSTSLAGISSISPMFTNFINKKKVASEEAKVEPRKVVRFKKKISLKQDSTNDKVLEMIKEKCSMHQTPIPKQTMESIEVDQSAKTKAQQHSLESNEYSVMDTYGDF